MLRLVLVLGWMLLAVPVQAVLLTRQGLGKTRWAQIYWRGMAMILGVRLRIIGAPVTARPVLFIANHSSWLDIIALGAVLPACFVAKGEIAHWPVINHIARLGRTIFVSRRRDTVAREQRLLEERLGEGENIILFPEGTTSDGSRVLPFSSAFFTLAFCPAHPVVQPVTIVHDELDGLPVRRAQRAEIAWFGDMELAPHALRLLRRRGMRATIVLGEPVSTAPPASRKSLAGALEREIAATAAALRQGRLPGGKHQADTEASPEFP